MAELVLLRHGRTAWNHEKRVQGQLDAQLDDTGREQAGRVADVLKLLQPTLLWSSDLVRARDTAAYVAGATGLEPVLDARLREFDLGERQGLTHDEYAAIAPEEFELFRQGYYDDAPGAETVAEVRARMVAALGEMLAALGPDDTGIAVTHGAAARVAIAAMLGWPDDAFHSLRALANCGWAVLGHHPETGDLRLAAYNRVAESWTPPPESRLVPRDAVG
ncbi:histidine phosphatase family protein [Nocardioides dilutus]